MLMIKITISGEPVPQSRPRFTANGHCYYPKKVCDWKETVSWQARQVMGNAQPMKGELLVVLKFYKKISPASKKFGDADNLAKAVLDSLNGICYFDDSQIVSLYVEKFRDDENFRCEIFIVPL